MEKQQLQYISYALIIIAIIFLVAEMYKLFDSVGGKWWFWTFPALSLICGGAGIYLLETSRQ